MQTHANPRMQVLEDIALTVQNQLVARVPFCAFNGGNDVFVDAGNKSLGLQAMMAFTGAQPHEVREVAQRGLGRKWSGLVLDDGERKVCWTWWRLLGTQPLACMG